VVKFLTFNQGTLVRFQQGAFFYQRTVDMKRFEKFRVFAEKPRQLFVVGGAVRDFFLGIDTSADVDLCLVGTESDILRIFGHCKRIHNDAPVWAVWIDGEMIEVALARREIGGGNSERAQFFVASSIEEDLLRRDFTVNAIAIDLFDMSVVDPHRGRDDIEEGILHPVSIQFVESPERVGRAAMMIARFGFTPSQGLLNVCRMMIDDFALIPREQMWKQFFGKMFEKGICFGSAFTFMKRVGVFDLFPIFDDMEDTLQDPEWHPEGNVMIHTLLAMQFAGNFVPHTADRALVTLALFGHDMGKTRCSQWSDGHIIAHGHEAQVDDFKRFMARIGVPVKMRSKALWLVKNHMRRDFPTNRSKARFVRKATEARVPLSAWAWVVLADHNARLKNVPMLDFVQDVLEFAEDFKDSVQSHSRPLVDGNDLIAAGLKGKQIGIALGVISDAFVSGEISTKDDAISLALATV
jgi:tRNA nucleotidyltransferase (CCA-adding enzyme)